MLSRTLCDAMDSRITELMKYKLQFDIGHQFHYCVTTSSDPVYVNTTHSQSSLRQSRANILFGFHLLRL